MTKAEILKKLAPCGLNCENCFAFTEGNIRHHSRELKKALGNFTPYAERFSELLNEPVFHTYPYFATQLDLFAAADCKGCREENCKLYKACNVRKCSHEKQIDFCVECELFPCSDTGFDDNLYSRWLRMNTRMKEVGIEIYCRETMEKPRYQ